MVVFLHISAFFLSLYGVQWILRNDFIAQITPFYELLRNCCGGLVRLSFSRIPTDPNPTCCLTSALTAAYIDIITARRWEELLARIVFHPEELLFVVDRRNQTVLHFACLFGAPAKIVEMILYQESGLASVANDDKEIPLHWAIRLSAPNEVIQLLLSVHPSSACCVLDRDGNTALSMTWERNESYLEDQIQNHRLNGSEAWSAILYFFRCYSYFLNAQKSTISPEDPAALRNIRKHVRNFLPLHTATQCSSCPSTLYRFFLRVFKKEIQQPDSNGRLPLALACEDRISNQSIGVPTKVHLLMTAYSPAALVPDLRGRLPLFIALESSISWDEGVDKLVLFDTKTLLLFDSVKRLPAFLLAAANDCTLNPRSNVKSEIGPRNHWSQVQLTTIFCILQTHPSQLSAVLYNKV